MAGKGLIYMGRVQGKRMTQVKVDKAIHHLNELRLCEDYLDVLGLTGVAELQRARDTLIELKRVEGWGN